MRYGTAFSDIGRRIRARRKELGLSQRELAHHAHTWQYLISQYESGMRVPSTPTLRKIARVLRVSADWLLFGEDCWN